MVDTPLQFHQAQKILFKYGGNVFIIASDRLIWTFGTLNLEAFIVDINAKLADPSKRLLLKSRMVVIPEFQGFWLGSSLRNWLAIRSGVWA